MNFLNENLESRLYANNFMVGLNIKNSWKNDGNNFRDIIIKFENKKILGIDWGEKRIGLATSDKLGKIATPFNKIEIKKNESMKVVFGNIKNIVSRETILFIVIGLPINMNGSFGFQSARVINFHKKLSLFMEYKNIFFWDERFTTSAVRGIMKEASLSFNKILEKKDEVSAAYMLQGVLDFLNF